MECLEKLLRYRLHLTKKMHPDATFYFVATTQTLTTSLSNKKLREMIATMCPSTDADTIVKEFNAVKELLEFEARDENVERLHTYINIIPQYDDPTPARIKMLKDML